MSWLDTIVAWFARRDPLTRAGELAAAEAVRLWRLDVYDPPKGDRSIGAMASLVVINDVIQRGGWTWVNYEGNGSPQWCGLFAGACWRTAGIDPKWLATFWASTLRLSRWIRYTDWNSTTAGKRPVSGGRMVLKLERDMPPAKMLMPDGTPPRAGDLVIVGDGKPVEGDHINVLLSFNVQTGIYETISGNGAGLGPDNLRREGIVRRNYVAHATSGYGVLWVMRPGAADLA